MNASSWVNLMLSYAQRARADVNIFESVFLAQTAIETGWGTSSAFIQGFNFAGTGGGPIDGYGSMEAGYQAYIDTMKPTGGSDFYAAVRSAPNPDAQAIALGNSPWAGSHYMATDGYQGGGPGTEIIELINQNNFTKYDSGASAPGGSATSAPGGPATTANGPTAYQLAIQHDSQLYPSSPGQTIPQLSSGQLPKSLAEEFKAFGNFTPIYGVNFKSTAEYLAGYLANNALANVPPPEPEAWEMRIGACKFVVPPVNIQVSTSYQTGSLVKGAIVQLTPPKFNSGHSETVVMVTLYFPNMESVWGFSNQSLNIDFNSPNQEAVVDQYLSSLRGLVTAFKYSPILPIQNVYLNSTFDITAVGLKTFNISTATDSNGMPIPYCLQVDLELLYFDHKVYLPMVASLNDAMDWGKYRMYMGKAAYLLEDAVDKSFVTSMPATTWPNATTGYAPDHAPDPMQNLMNNYKGTVGYSVASDLLNATNVNFYYPSSDPAGLIPDLMTQATFLPGNQQAKNTGGQSAWSQLLSTLGTTQTNLGTWTEVSSYLNDPAVLNQYQVLTKWLKFNSATVNVFNDTTKQQWINSQTQGLTGNALLNAQVKAEQGWWVGLYNTYLGKNSPLQADFTMQQFFNGQRLIDEWTVPMTLLPLDAKKVIVQSVSAQIVNNFARLPLSMMENPTYQFIGGLGTNIEINLRVIGETDLTNIREMYKRIAGLSRLEHGHAVLGFLGIQNIIVALCGTKYVLPSSFTVSTVSGMPHNYMVKMVFTDFDIFQQKREILSNEQQQSLIRQFGKANPFFRLKQNWSAFSAYPDFPLGVTDPKTKDMVGHLDPDFYFAAYSTIQSDITTSISKHVSEPPNGSANYSIVHHLLTDQKGNMHSIGLNGGYYDLLTNNKPHPGGGGLANWEYHTGNTATTPQVPGLTPASGYITPTFTPPSGSTTLSGGADPSTQGFVDNNYLLMLEDSQYRDKAGRMIRAFPTYMLWLIDEGGMYAGINLYNNLYGLQSVLDFSFVDNEDVMGTTMILRVSNLYSRLSTAYNTQLDPALFPNAPIMNVQINQVRNLTGGTTNFVPPVPTIDLKPGIRLHFRVGYGGNPNLLETVFNGVVTQVQEGDIMTIIAQSDAIELGAVVNNTNTSGTSGDIDGALFSGLSFSEPRDLMIRLLSMGASTMQEFVAEATGGMIYSQNRFGIRHFGRVIYNAMTNGETRNRNAQQTFLGSSGFKTINDTSQIMSSIAMNPIVSGTDSILNGSAISLLHDMWINFSTKRDFEVFKRNIYPGNGTGISQYMGGDLGDGGLATGFTPPGLNPNGTVSPNSITGKLVNPTTGLVYATASNIANNKVKSANNSDTGISQWINQGEGVMHNLLGLIGVTKMDATSPTMPGAAGSFMGFGGPFAEVSFRAWTYMKTVWDLFVECAALLPNYIIAVRPFEDRSTIFYGKPHWAYTSALLPVTTGPTAGTAGIVSPDTAVTKLQQQVENAMNQQPASVRAKSAAQSQYNTIQNSIQQALSPNSGTLDPGATVKGMVWKGSDISSLPQSYAGATVPHQRGTVRQGEHLPTSSDLNTDIIQHMQNQALPYQFRHPVFMRHENNDPKKAGVPSKAFGYLAPSDEQWYIAMPWTAAPSSYGPPINNEQGRRIMVYCQDTGNAVVCTPGDIQSEILVSPDTWLFLGDPPQNNTCWFGFVADSTPLGPVIFATGDTFNGQVLPTVQTPALNMTTTGTVLTVPAGSSKGAPSWMGANPSVGMTPEQYSLKYGGTQRGGSTISAVPIDFGPGDIYGQQAYNVFKNSYSLEEGDSIWEQFRQYFRTDSQVVSIYVNAFPSQSNYNAPGPVTTTTYTNVGLFNRILDEFQNIMWRNAYYRGWLVLTISKTPTVGGAWNDVVKWFTHAHWFGAPSASQSYMAGIPGIHASGAGGGWINYEIEPFFPSQGLPWNFDMAHKLFAVFVKSAAKGGYGAGSKSTNPQALQDFMTGNTSSTGAISALVHKAESTVPLLTSAVTKLFNDVGAVVSGVVNSLRLSMMTLSNGLNAAALMGAQANMLNSVFNDSIYYDQRLGIGSLMWRCDNPFTREYGEPLVEIREPFQRMHFIDSFQHIIANGIMETMNNVKTVMTATSQGMHPITVNFDKSAPAYMQIEGTMESGLQWQAPASFLGILAHPMLQIRSWATHFNNGDNATDASRVARTALRNSLADIYTGELIVLGNSEIRPHDLVYLNDSYSKMYGLFEVQQVVHQFSPDVGFITSITPNAIVTVNDPAKWQWGSQVGRAGAMKALRDSMRNIAQATSNASAVAAAGSQVAHSAHMTLNDLANQASTALLGTTQYTGGIGALVKDTGATAGYGSLVRHPQNKYKNAGIDAKGAVGGAVAGAGIGATVGSVPGAVVGGAIGAVAGSGVGSYVTGQITGGSISQILQWPLYSFMRDHLFDAHACYINYLNRNGTPMDAGLSNNYGTAVGQANVVTLMGDSLAIPVSEGGQTTISMSDLLTNIGWTPKDVIAQANQQSLQANYVYNQVLQLSGKSSPPIGQPQIVSLIQILSVENGYTFNFTDIGGKLAGAGINAQRAQLAYITAPNMTKISMGSKEQMAAEATAYFQNIVNNLTAYQTLVPTAVVRVNPQNAKTSNGTLLVELFYTTPSGTLLGSQTRTDILTKYANSDVQWDDYLSNGKPYTLNWELVAQGLARVDPLQASGSDVPKSLYTQGG